MKYSCFEDALMHLRAMSQTLGNVELLRWVADIKAKTDALEKKISSLEEKLKGEK